MLWLISSILGLIFGGLIVFIFHQKKITQLNSQLKAYQSIEVLNKDLEQKFLEKEDKYNTLLINNNEKEKELAVLNTQLSEKEARYQEIHLTLKSQNETYLNELDLLRKESNQQSNLVSQLKNQLENDQKRLNDLKEAKDDLSKQFKIVAQEVLDQKSKQHKEGLDLLLAPFKEQVKGFSEKIEQYHIQGKQDQATLKSALETEVKRMMQLSQNIKQDADNLAKALKGDKKIQGNWGELILERVLETSGLRQGIEYSVQKTLQDDDNQNFRPDVIVHLPEGKSVIVDSKVSLVAYERYTRSTDELSANQALKEHIQSIRNHITQLSDKAYQALSGVKSLDFVLLFIPIESAFVLAFQNDERLFSEAFNKRIIVVTPTTLLATLRTIENIWRYENQNKNAKDIADRAQKMLDKFRGFVEDLEGVGNQIIKLQKTHEDAMNKLAKGRGNLISQADKLLKLGVPMNKNLPQNILDYSDISEN